MARWLLFIWALFTGDMIDMVGPTAPNAEKLLSLSSCRITLITKTRITAAAILNTKLIKTSSINQGLCNATIVQNRQNDLFETMFNVC